MTSDELYGTDEWCFDGAQSARMISGRMLLAQDVYNCLRTEPGKLKGSKTAGKVGAGLRGFVGAVGLVRAAAAIPARVDAALRADDRIARVRTVVTPREESPGSGVHTLDVAITVTPREGDSFSLTIAVGDDVLSLLGVSL